MGTDNTHGLNRRSVLRKTAAAGATAIGAAAMTGSAAASHIENYDTVEVTENSYTYSKCCTAAPDCIGASRDTGECGTVIPGECGYGDPDLVRVFWCNSGDGLTTSYIDHDNLKVIS